MRRGRHWWAIWPSHTAALLCLQGIFYSGLVCSQEICTAGHWSGFIKGKGIFLAHIKGTWIPFLQKHPNGFNRSSDLSPFDIWLHSEWKKQSLSWETGHFPSGHKTPFLDCGVYLNREHCWWKKMSFLQTQSSTFWDTQSHQVKGYCVFSFPMISLPSGC